MTLVYTLGDEIEVSVDRDGNDFIAVVALGYDDDRDLDYSTMVGFREVPGEIEYFFCLIAANNEDGHKEYYYQGLRTKAFIRDEDRNNVLSAILTATDVLLDHTQPERFFRITFEDNLPDKALEKHHALTRLFESRGYRVTTYDPYHGKRTWVMERGTT
jgi:hypothetical protein